VFMQEEVRAKLLKYQRQTPVKTVDSSTSTPQPQVEVCINPGLQSSGIWQHVDWWYTDISEMLPPSSGKAENKVLR